MIENQVFHCTVTDLIKALSTFLSDAPALTSKYENGYENIQQPVLENVVHCPDNPYYDGEFQLAGESDSRPIQAILIPGLKDILIKIHPVWKNGNRVE